MGTHTIYIPTDLEEELMLAYYAMKKTRKDLTISMFITEELRQLYQAKKKVA
jgi:hypothetical protein